MMRSARQCLDKAAELKRAAGECRDTAMASCYQEAAASWRHLALQAEWQDRFLPGMDNRTATARS